MQPGVGLPRVFSLVMKRCFPRRFRDSAAQALELPQHHSGAAQVRHPHLGLVLSMHSDMLLCVCTEAVLQKDALEDAICRPNRRGEGRPPREEEWKPTPKWATARLGCIV